MHDDESVVTLGDAARALDIPYQTVHSAWRNGRIPYQRAGMAILVKVSEVAAAFAAYQPRKPFTPKEVNAE